MAVLRQLDELIKQARKLSDRSRVTLTGELEDLRVSVRYCFEELGPLAQDALREANQLEFNLPADSQETQEFQAQGYENLAKLLKWLETVKTRVETGQRSPARPTPRKLPVPPDTAWADVRIRFVSEREVQIWVRDTSEVRNYAEMGFEDRRKRLPDSSWHALRVLAEYRGVIRNQLEVRVDTWSRVEKAIQKIRERFRWIFGIADDPFEPFQKARCYKAKFVIECSESYKD